MKKSRRIASFLMLSSAKIEDVLLICCVFFDVVKFENRGSLTEQLRFQACRQIDRKRERQIDGWMDGQMDRWIDGQIDRQVDQIRFRLVLDQIRLDRLIDSLIDRQLDRKKDRYIDRQVGRQVDSQRKREKDREREETSSTFRSINGFALSPRIHNNQSLLQVSYF